MSDNQFGPIMASFVQVKPKPSGKVSESAVELQFKLDNGDTHTVQLKSIGAALLSLMLPDTLAYLLDQLDPAERKKGDA